MIEQVMIFALGFLVSGLLTLMFLPAFWRRALRLSTRRLEMQMPLSMAEIVAERDQLRAEFATERRRIEQHSEALVADRARDMGELGRRSRLIGALDGELAENRRKVLEQRVALDAAERRIADAEGQSAAVDKQLFDVEGSLARISDANAELDRSYKALTAVAEERRAAIAALETRAAGLAMRIEDLERQSQKAVRKGSAKETATQRLGEELDFVKVSAAATASKLQVALAKIEDLSAEAGRLRGTLDEERRAKQPLEEKTQIDARSLADAAEREAALRAELAAMRNGATPTADLEEPIGAAQEDAMLRQTIKEIGSEVTRLVHSLEDQSQSRGEAPGAGLGELMRSLQARAGRTAPSN